MAYNAINKVQPRCADINRIHRVQDAKIDKQDAKMLKIDKQDAKGRPETPSSEILLRLY